LKLHALLCRSYVKGRDWYDFVWYVARGVRPDLELLRNALHQQGPWAGQQTSVTWPWLIANLRTVIGRIDWAIARQDVRALRLGARRRRPMLSFLQEIGWARQLTARLPLRTLRSNENTDFSIIYSGIDE
jgi:hypothetical protein